MTHRIGTLVTLVALGLGSSACTGGGGDDVVVLLDTYEPCALTEECVPEDLCLEISTETAGRIVTDAICTHECFDDLDCPSSVTGLPGACLDIGSGPFCYERCFDDLDCPSGFACTDTFGGAQDSVCLPF